MYMSNIILQTSLPLINIINFINDFLDTLLEEYCSQHYQENIENIISDVETIYSQYLTDATLPNII